MSSRLANIAKPGELFKQYAPDKRKADEPKGRQEDRAHLALVRRLPCVICGSEPCDAAHVRAPSTAHGKRSTPAGAKPDDKWTLPLCRKHHVAQHKGPEIRFWWDAQISPVKLCQDLYAVTGDLEAMRKIVMEARG